MSSYARLYLYLIQVSAAFSVEIQVVGELAFDIKISDDGQKGDADAVLRSRGQDKKGKEYKMTAAPQLECLYQYPDVEQLNAITSNMMNELTKVFIRINELMIYHSGRRGQETRFRVVDKKGSTFFEPIYSNMTQEYTEFYNSTTSRVSRASKDPCENQKELKEVWRRLLERSLSSLRRAAQRCMEEYLRVQNRSNDQHFQYKLKQFLLRELPKVRSSQLHQLCDNFQLCYNDLL